MSMKSYSGPRGLKAAMVAALVTLALPTLSNAATIDFSALASGTVVTTQYDGVVFSLGGTGTLGNPVVNWGGLTNSTTGDYPTASNLIVDFTSAATNVSFVYDNEGNNSGFPSGGSFYRAVLTNGSVITGSLATADDQLFSVAGIVDYITFSNGLDGTAGSWIFDLDRLTYTSVAAVPGPIAGAGLPALLALGGFVWAHRRKAAVA